jgi:hypothetical protein
MNSIGSLVSAVVPASAPWQKASDCEESSKKGFRRQIVARLHHAPGQSLQALGTSASTKFRIFLSQRR